MAHFTLTRVVVRTARVSVTGDDDQDEDEQKVPPYNVNTHDTDTPRNPLENGSVLHFPVIKFRGRGTSLTQNTAQHAEDNTAKQKEGGGSRGSVT